MKLTRLLAVLIPLLLLVPLRVSGAREKGTLERLQEVDSRRLLERGEEWLSKPEGADSALICFSVVSARYAPSATKSEKEMAVTALRGKWLVYFSYLYDYPKAYEAIQEALRICNEEGIDKANVQISLGGMLQVMADMGDSEDLYREAVSSYTGGLREAVQRGEYPLADRAFINLITTSVALNSTDSVRAVWPLFRSLPDSPEAHRRRFAKILYENYLSTPAGTDSEAIDALVNGVSSLPEDSEYSRLRYIGLHAAAEKAVQSRNLTLGVELARKAYRYASENSIRDAEVESALFLSQLLRRTGRDSEAGEIYDQYLRLKERMIGSRLIQRLDELRFMADIQKADKRMALLREEKKRQSWIIGLLSLIVVLIGVAGWIVFSKNRRLTEANLSLRRQFDLGVASANRERKLIRRLEEEEKYTGSSLSDSERERIMTAINRIVDSSETICAPDFSIAKMAESVGCNAKYLSQVINEEFGCNFNTFINKYRINEAARRLTDPGEWSKLTIEGIANSVGFRSRSTFVTLFKQFTGTTPSDYRKGKQ